jgi:hypothetical protein
MLAFDERPAHQSIEYTFFGAADSMPKGTAIQEGDCVTLMIAGSTVDVVIAGAIVLSRLSGRVEAICDANGNEVPALVTTTGRVDLEECVEFSEAHIYRCTRRSDA